MVLIPFLCAVSAQSQLPFLSPIFGSHMVMQRDKANTLWGWTNPGETVSVSMEGKTVRTKAGPDGKWVVRISPPPTGGPYTMSVDGSQHLKLEDVLVGDVWVCGGQSNMEMGINGVNNAEQEIADANRPTMRLFIVAKTALEEPTKTVTGQWAVCSPQSIVEGGWGGFSAVGYFFGRELSERLHIPIGLVSDNWGGTIAEAWTSKQGLKSFPEFQPAIKALDATAGTTPDQRLENWATQNDPGTQNHWEAESLDDSTWGGPGQPQFEAAGWNTFDGVGWFRASVELPNPLPEGDVHFDLGDVDDVGTLWINGSMLGNTYLFSGAHDYLVPKNLLHPGKNSIAVRIIDTGGPGGLNTGRQALHIGGANFPIAPNQWRWSKGAELSRSKPLPALGGNPNVPTVLYNGMIAPVAPLAIKGAIWYQGESNAGRAQQYQRLLPAMIADWRRAFGQGDFPFFIVQLANFQARHPEPVEDAWAEIREAQAMTASKVKNSGLAVAIDIGDHNDIHPKDKQDVGKRLALQALHVAYEFMLEYSGPVFKATKQEGAQLRVLFDHARGLNSHGDLKGFQVAGPDGKFYWADAKIDGESVLVSAPQVAHPVSVRYAWDMDPEATLYNGADLPAVPFRYISARGK